MVLHYGISKEGQNILGIDHYLGKEKTVSIY